MYSQTQQRQMHKENQRKKKRKFIHTRKKVISKVGKWEEDAKLVEELIIMGKENFVYRHLIKVNNETITAGIHSTKENEQQKKRRRKRGSKKESKTSDRNELNKDEKE